MIDDFRNLYRILDEDQRRSLVGVLGVLVVAAGFQVVGVGSVLPFLQVLTNPEVVESGWIGRVYDWVGVQDRKTFLGMLGLGSFFLVLAANASLAFAHYTKQRFAHNFNHSLTMRLMAQYLGQDYEYFLDQNTAELNQRILSEARHLSNSQVLPALTLLSRAAIAIALLAFLLVIDPMATLLLAGFVGGGFGLFFWSIRKRLEGLGDTYVEANRNRYQTSSEAFSTIKDVKLLGKEDFFLDALRPPSRKLSTNLAWKNVFQRLPQYAVETLVFGGMLLVLAVFLLTGRPVVDFIPTIGVIAFAGYRLMPALRHIIKGGANFRFNDELMERVLSDLRGPNELTTGVREASTAEPGLRVRDAVELRDVTYTYPGTEEPALEDVSIALAKGSDVAVVGETGAGKTTLIDVFLGLLDPDEGGIYVDGEQVGEDRLSSWQRVVGYVPQKIKLRDTTVAQNIAFGVPPDEIDPDAIEEAARTAQIHEFVVEDLPDGYETEVGEDGVRLSGGQRQRIGIARALYQDPDVLVLDEATSDIDGATEAQIADAIRDVASDMTFLIVAHRFATIEGCDRIYVVEGGRVVAEGDYESLLESDETFRALAQA